MTEKSQVFKCKHCGSIIAVLKGGEGKFSCCNEEMMEVTPDEAKRFTYNMQEPGTP
jgi:desulfoferrodoxin-like iron-binding protein